MSFNEITVPSRPGISAGFEDERTGEVTEVDRMTVTQADPVSATFRDVMASVCTPISVVTALSGEMPYGSTVSAFASLSMAPPMVLVSLDRHSSLLPVLRQSGRFGLNVLASDQSALALRFARKGGSAKFAGARWDIDGGAPRLPNVAGFLACEVAELVEGGDHLVVMGLVRFADQVTLPPLTYHSRSFGTHTVLVEDTYDHDDWY